MSCAVSACLCGAMDCVFLSNEYVFKMNLHTVIWLLNGWVFFYELSGCGFDSHCSHLMIEKPVLNTADGMLCQIVREISSVRYFPLMNWTRVHTGYSSHIFPYLIYIQECTDHWNTSQTIKFSTKDFLSKCYWRYP